MTKKTETKPTPPPETASIPELEPKDVPAEEAPTVSHFPTYPDDIALIADQAYAAALSDGYGEGDAEAIGIRAARKWAREHNRRMPD